MAAGASVAEGAASSASSLSTKLTQFGLNVAGSTLSSAGMSGLKYDVQHGRDFTAKGFFEAMGIGAAAGFASGVVGGVGGHATSGLSGKKGRSGIAARIGAKAAVGGVSGAVSGDVTTILTNVQQHQPWYQGLAKSTVTGFAKGAGSSAASGAWSERVNIAKAAGVSDQTLTRVSNIVDKVKSAALSGAAYKINGTAAFFAMPGYVVWGAADSWGRQD
ncbi:Insecticidal toxin complex protein TcaC [Cystobacter fuscus DSM 2262]|uniref:Insecticidal toxin complex protein TcaC n=1 Tax=Cystobacter fuscus (strain ATCC 25194 / DSM 2262 / NBRC 100088 / M29) TaxID=1242864 RepID=S9P850_CYSF2|nr:Insecticidal toxin complex protein TcaC [Cystobacter fuscus DSM 2262]